MKRLVYLLESDEGFLCDIEAYTRDVSVAATFTSFEAAQTKLIEVNELLKRECWIGVGFLSFPRGRSLLKAL
jgi:hypothetical protein